MSTKPKVFVNGKYRKSLQVSNFIFSFDEDLGQMKVLFNRKRPHLKTGDKVDITIDNYLVFSAKVFKDKENIRFIDNGRIVLQRVEA
jgi:hypothetical protein